LSIDPDTDSIGRVVGNLQRKLKLTAMRDLKKREGTPSVPSTVGLSIGSESYQGENFQREGERTSYYLNLREGMVFRDWKNRSRVPI